MTIAITTIIGARPQFVKSAIVSVALHRQGGFFETLIHTGQHFDGNMSDIFFDQFGMKEPEYNLDIHGGTHAEMTARMMVEIEQTFLKTKPDYVMVYGDTNSTLAGALVASKMHIPVIHVEAGLRSFNMQMPEEVNRILTDQVSNILFCPTDLAIENLHHENLNNRKNVRIIKNGDVMQDAAIKFKDKAQRPAGDDLPDQGFAVCTFHRPDNTDKADNLKSIVDALNKIHETMPVILPLHPRTKAAIERENLTLNVHVIDAVGYLEMLWLLDNCSIVLTDSGGLQKEAFFFLKPCVTLRDETEWVELIDMGANILTGAHYDKILDAVNQSMGKIITDPDQIYGGGNAGDIVAREIAKAQ